MYSDNYDDYDFVPTTKSNLASLFETPEDSNLTYTAPKQPKPQRNEDITCKSSDTSVINAKVVNTWKLENSQYSLIGKYGLAIIGSPAKKEYEIIIYKDKKNVITRVKVCPTFTFTLTERNYATFFDTNGQNWSVMFNSDNDRDSFVTDFEKIGGIIKYDLPKTPSTTDCPTSSSCKSDDGDQSDESDNRQRADILSRIARMGQSMFPNVSKAQSTDISDDESVETNKLVDTISMKNNKEIFCKQITTQEAIMLSAETPIIQPQYVNPQVNPLNMYLLENKAQNTEIRLNMAQISSKIDQILSKFDNGGVQRGSNEDNALKSKIKVLELRIENLSKELKRYQDMYVNLQKEMKCKISMECNEEQRRIEVEAYLKKIQEQEQDIEQLNKIIKEQSKQLDNGKLYIQKITEKNENNEEIIKELNNKLRELQDAEEAEKDKGKTTESDDFVEKLKKSMNLVFNSTMGKFEPNKEYCYSEIEAIIAQSIRACTFKVLQKYGENL